MPVNALSFHVTSVKDNGDGTFGVNVQGGLVFTVASVLDFQKQLSVYRQRQSDLAQLQTLVGTDVVVSNT